MKESITQETVEAIGTKVGAGVTYLGSGGAVVAGLTLTEWGVIVGILTAIVGLGLQWYFGSLRNKREAEVHAASMRHLNGGPQG